MQMESALCILEHIINWRMGRERERERVIEDTRQSNIKEKQRERERERERGIGGICGTEWRQLDWSLSGRFYPDQVGRCPCDAHIFMPCYWLQPAAVPGRRTPGSDSCLCSLPSLRAAGPEAPGSQHTVKIPTGA